MDQATVSLIALLIFAAGTAAVILAFSALIGRRAAPDGRAIPYECGLDPAARAGRRIPVKFFLVAVLFLIFDVEVALLVPWAAAFRGGLAAGEGPALAVELAAFVGLLAVALAYAWSRGALEWEK